MKPSLNAIYGYSYQQQMSLMLLVLMDIERIIESIEIEPNDAGNFDDLKVQINGLSVFFQMKDLDSITLNNLKIEDGKVAINGNIHSLPQGASILSFKKIHLNCNSKILGFPSFQEKGLYILSLSREQIFERIENAYKRDKTRIYQIISFFERCLDSRINKIEQKDLPLIEIFETKLIEETITISRIQLNVDNILVIEGRPGIGKSHFVNSIVDDYKNNVLYRFWISNQDKFYSERLKYDNFIFNISKEIFRDYAYHSESDIIDRLHKENKAFIVDGFDHVENYNVTEINKYKEFIQKIGSVCKVILLTRPLQNKLPWHTINLNNWSETDTFRVLEELYHISDYTVRKKVFTITNGYPILVRYISEHFKKFGSLPDIGQIESVESYYESLLVNVKVKNALSLFISSRSFIMNSEITMFLDSELAAIVTEFIKDFPYLFERRLNRTSLFHDSFNTFIQNLGIDNFERKRKVNEIVLKSLLKLESRFQSRFSYFNLSSKEKLKVIKIYSSMEVFKELIKRCIDFEALRTFYKQIRESLEEIDPCELKIEDYYDLSLILNLVSRDHVSSLNHFYYTFAKCLIYNEFDEENVTSSEYLFSMFYYIRTKDASLIQRTLGDDYFSTDSFYEKFEQEVYAEDNYFDAHSSAYKLEIKFPNILIDANLMEMDQRLTSLLENLYIYRRTEGHEDLLKFQDSIICYMDISEEKGLEKFQTALRKYKKFHYADRYILKNAKNKIESLGISEKSKKYRDLSLKEFILKYRKNGSFSMWVKVLNYLRLSMYENRRIDIENIHLFWLMYHERKDYTVTNIDTALKAFEDKDLIKDIDSCRIIARTMSMSEKGIRHLFNDYIELHSPNILHTIERNFEFDEISVNWFQLPVIFMDSFSQNIFREAVSQLLRSNQVSRTLEVEEIEKVVSSKWNSTFSEIMKIYDFKVKINKDHKLVSKLEKIGFSLKFNEIKEKRESKIENESSLERFNQGILNGKDIEFIKESKLPISQVAGYGDGYYTVLSELDIFKAYEEDQVRANFQTILRSALLSKIGSISRFSNLYYFVGNVPKILIDYKIEQSMENLFASFCDFMDLSGLLPEKV
ncbi:hypothetical protein [Leptospira santarosai]|uniref:hypothetical protein n=2 Tax=Leptospira santarosai TaxID=28183 RepID=UPI0002D46EEA|nr:hypothetical protein [Leptospira santarosai]MDI7226608.1 hypothetical protein [Leptospira santarosai]